MNTLAITKKRTALSLPHAQEKFCQNIMQGMNATQAYADAFPKCSHRSAGTGACRLQGRPKVAARLAQLREQEEQRCLMRRARRLERLREIAESDSSNTRDVITAIKTINDMAGDGVKNAPEREKSQIDSLCLMLRHIRESAS